MTVMRMLCTDNLSLFSQLIYRLFQLVRTIQYLNILHPINYLYIQAKYLCVAMDIKKFKR